MMSSLRLDMVTRPRKNKINQTDDEQSQVKHGNEARENKNNQNDDEQSESRNGHRANANIPVS